MSGGGIVLGIDVATSALRVIALDTDNGSVAAAAETGLPSVVGSAGERSQAANYGPVAVATLTEVAAKLGASAKRIRAISTTGTSGTIVPADKRGNPVGRAHHVQRRPRQGGTPPA
jgi:xylulokinase